MWNTLEALTYLMTRPGDVLAFGLSEWTLRTTAALITAMAAALVLCVIEGDVMRRVGFRVDALRWSLATAGLVGLSAALFVLVRGLVY